MQIKTEVMGLLAQEHVQEMSCCRPPRVCILHEKTQVVFVILDFDLFSNMKSDISHLGSIAVRSVLFI